MYLCMCVHICSVVDTYAYLYMCVPTCVPTLFNPGCHSSGAVYFVFETGSVIELELSKLG